MIEIDIASHSNEPIEGGIDSDDDEMVFKAKQKREKSEARKARVLERKAEKVLKAANAARLGLGQSVNFEQKIVTEPITKSENCAKEETKTETNIESLILQVKSGVGPSSDHAGVPKNVKIS